MKKGSFVSLLNASILGVITGLSIKYVDIHVDKPVSLSNLNFEGISIGKSLPKSVATAPLPDMPAEKVTAIQNETQSTVQVHAEPKKSETEIVVTMIDPPVEEEVHPNIFNDLSTSNILVAKPNVEPEPEIPYEEIYADYDGEVWLSDEYVAMKMEEMEPEIPYAEIYAEYDGDVWLSDEYVAMKMAEMEPVIPKIDYAFNGTSTLSMAERMYYVMSTHVNSLVAPTFSYAAEAHLNAVAIEENRTAKEEANRKRLEEEQAKKQAEEAEALAKKKAEEEAEKLAAIQREKQKIEDEKAKLAQERKRLEKLKASLTQSTAPQPSQVSPLNTLETHIVNALSDILLKYNLDSKPKTLSESQFREVTSIVIDSINTEFTRVHGHPMFKRNYELYERNDRENMMLIYFTPETSAKPEVVSTLTTSIRLIDEGLSHAPSIPTDVRFLPSRS